MTGLFCPDTQSVNGIQYGVLRTITLLMKRYENEMLLFSEKLLLLLLGLWHDLMAVTITGSCVTEIVAGSDSICCYRSVYH